MINSVKCFLQVKENNTGEMTISPVIVDRGLLNYWMSIAPVIIDILPPATSKNVFDVGLHNFSIILNLFHSNKPFALSSDNLVLCSETYFYMRFETIHAIIFRRKNFKVLKTMTNSSTNFILKFKFLWLSLFNLNQMTTFCKSTLHLRFRIARNAISLKTASKIIAYVQFTYHVKCLKHDQFSWNLF